VELVRATALMLAKQGAKVVLGAPGSERLVELVTRINKNAGEAVFAVADGRHRDDLVHLVKLAVDQYGRLDVIISNAGVNELSCMDELDVEGREEMVDVNLKGTLYGIAAAIRVFLEQGSVIEPGIF